MDPATPASPAETDPISDNDDTGSILPVLDYESEGSTDLVSDGSATPAFIGVAGETANTAANATAAFAAAADSDAQKQACEKQTRKRQQQTQREQEAHDKQSPKDFLNALRRQAGRNPDPLATPVTPANTPTQSTLLERMRLDMARQ